MKDLVRLFPDINEFSIAIIKVGSRAQSTPELVDERSDEDFLLIQDNPVNISRRLIPLQGKSDSHYGIISMAFLNSIMESDYIVPVRASPWVYLTTNYIESFTNPVYSTPTFTEWVYSTDMSSLQRMGALKYIQAHGGIIDSINKGAIATLNSFKCIHHLIRAYCLVKQDFTLYEIERVRRIKRSGISPLCDSDIEYVKTFMELLAPYVRMDISKWRNENLPNTLLIK